MRRLLLVSSILLLAFFALGLYLSLYSPNILPENSIGTNHHLFYDYRGVSHVVSKHTRGSLYPKDILLHAVKANLDFIFFTDLNLLNRPYDIQGYHGNVFVFTHQKISFLDSHLLIYPENPQFYFDSLSVAHANLTEHLSRSYLEEQNYLAVLAHPLKDSHPWAGKFPRGLDGIEVLNLRQLWQEIWVKNKPSFIWSVLTYGFNPKLSLMRLLEDPIGEIELWDQLNLSSRALGFLGNHSTARIFSLLGLHFPFPPYNESFAFAANHILLSSELTGHEETDRNKIYNAIKKGHFYFSLDTFGDPKGFAAYIKYQDDIYSMGDQVTLKPDMELSVDLPNNLEVPFEIELRRNGEKIAISKEQNTSFKVTKNGNYRIIIRIQLKLPIPDGAKWYSWIYTNNFYIN